MEGQPYLLRMQERKRDFMNTAEKPYTRLGPPQRGQAYRRAARASRSPKRMSMSQTDSLIMDTSVNVDMDLYTEVFKRAPPLHCGITPIHM